MFQRFFGGSNSTIPAISPPDAWKRLSQTGVKPVLIDVREGWEFKSGHAKGAKNIPLSQIQKRVGEVPRDREVLLICQSGHRSMRAARFMQNQGIEQIVNVTGGTTVWKMHGIPME